MLTSGTSCFEKSSEVRFVPILDLCNTFTPFWHFPSFCKRSWPLLFTSHYKVGVLLLSWAQLLRWAVCCSCHRTKSLAHAMCEMRLWLWQPVASHLAVSHVILQTSIIFRMESSLWKHHFYGVSGIRSCATTNPQGNDWSLTDACPVLFWFFYRKVSTLSLSPTIFPLQKH